MNSYQGATPGLKILKALIPGLVLFGLSLASLALFKTAPDVPPRFWPPAGLLLTILLVAEMRDWPLFLAATLPAMGLAHAIAGTPGGLAVGYALAHGGDAFCGAGLIRLFIGRRPCLDALQQVLVLSLVLAFSSAPLSATLGASFAMLYHTQPAFSDVWGAWWLAHLLGGLTVTPVFLSLLRSRETRQGLPPNRAPEAMMLYCVMAMTAYLTFGATLPVLDSNHSLLAVPFPLLLWGAKRLGMTVTTTAVLIYSCMAMALAPESLWLMPHILIIVISGLILAVMMKERGQMGNLLGLQASLGKALARAGSMAGAMEITLATAINLEDVDCGSAHVAGPSGELDLVSHSGLTEELLREVKHFESDSFYSSLVAEGNPIFVSLPMARRSLSLFAKGRLRGLAVLPLVHEKQALGCLVFGSRNRERFPNGTCNALLALTNQLRNVLVRLNAQDELVKNERRLRKLLQSTSEGYMFLSPAFTILDVNRSLCQMLGYSREELVGMTPYALVDKDNKLVLKQQEQLIPVTTHRSFLLTMTAKDKAHVHTLFSASTIYEDSGAMQGVFALITDVTERQRIFEMIRQSEERYKSILEIAPDAIIISALGDGGIQQVNQAFTSLSGYSSEEANGKTIEELGLYVDPKDSERLRNLLMNHGEVNGEEITFAVKGGETKTAQLSARLLAMGGEDFVVSVITDISEAKNIERALRHSEERYRMVADHHHGWETWFGPDNTVLYMSPSCERISGYGPERFIEDSGFLERIIHSDDLVQWRRFLNNELGPEGDTLDFRIIHRDGRARWICLAGKRVQDKDGTPMGIRTSMRDITHRKEMENQLRHQSLHDPLTGLANRTLCLDRIAQAMARSKRRSDYCFAVAFLDLDRFKVINESLGHLVGDKLITEVARRIQQGARRLDTVSRFSGDQFVILLEELHSPRLAIQIVKRIRDQIKKPYNIDGKELRLSASFGIVLNQVEVDQPEELLRNANIAMHRAKDLGRDKFKIFTKHMLEQTLHALTLESDLRRGIGNQEFFLNFQPIVSMEDESLYGLEALCRWNHAEKGLIRPGEFIPMAEESGLIEELGNWVLTEACATMARWRREYPHISDSLLSVNISGKQFSQPGLVSQIAQTLELTGMPANRLKLEITETTIMENAELAVEKLARLKGLGITLSIDDFGTGYSSMSYLQQFPLDNLKIDLSFVRMLDVSSENIEIVKAIISLAHTLNLQVVAEGVENLAQKQVLAALGCEYIQGYLIARPLSPEDAKEYLLRAIPAPAAQQESKINIA